MTLNKKIVDGGLFLIGLYCFVSILIGAYYAYPNAEDLSVALIAREQGVFDSAVYLLQTFDGRYTTNILHGLNPLAFDFYYGYKLMPVITFCLLTFALFTLFNNQFREKRKMENGLYAFVFVSLFFSVLDLSQSLFWMICTFVYIYPIIFFLLFYSFFLRYKYSMRIQYYVFSLLFLFLSIGCCELYIPIWGILLLCMFLKFKSNTEFKRTIIWYIIVYLFSSLFFVTSPGITYRMGVYKELRNESFNDLLHQAIDYSVSTFSSWAFLPLLLFVILFTINYLGVKKLKYHVLVLLIGIVSILCIWIVVLVLMGNSGFSTRIIPVVVTLFLLTLLYTLSNYTKFLLSKKTFLVIGFFVLFFCVKNSYSHIYRDLNSGRLTQFKQEMDLQYHMLNNVKADSCFSPVFIKDVTPILPASIASQPYIKANRYGKTPQGEWHGEWYNVYESYFRVDEVRLVGDTTKILQRIYEKKK